MTTLAANARASEGGAREADAPPTERHPEATCVRHTKSLTGIVLGSEETSGACREARASGLDSIRTFCTR